MDKVIIYERLASLFNELREQSRKDADTIEIQRSRIDSLEADNENLREVLHHIGETLQNI